jgi:hypothetical protein
MNEQLSEVPEFYVPAATAEHQEGIYAEMAERCRAAVLPLGRRIYSIKFVHDGEEWTATVGRSLFGITLPYSRSRSKKPFRPVPVYDNAMVLAIFPGKPYMVFTSGGITVTSKWVNPFMAGEPEAVTYFAKP